MLIMILFFCLAILFESAAEILAEHIKQKIVNHIPRNKRGYPRIKSLV